MITVNTIFMIKIVVIPQWLHWGAIRKKMCFPLKPYKYLCVCYDAGFLLSSPQNSPAFFSFLVRVAYFSTLGIHHSHKTPVTAAFAYCVACFYGFSKPILHFTKPATYSPVFILVLIFCPVGDIADLSSAVRPWIALVYLFLSYIVVFCLISNLKFLVIYDENLQNASSLLRGLELMWRINAELRNPPAKYLDQIQPAQVTTSCSGQREFTFFIVLRYFCV